MSELSAPSEQNLYQVEHVNLLRQSFQELVGRDLVYAGLGAVEAAQTIYEAPFVVVSHDTAADPVFNYGNKAW